jgi:hypothetical protein
LHVSSTSRSARNFTQLHQKVEDTASTIGLCQGSMRQAQHQCKLCQHAACRAE